MCARKLVGMCSLSGIHITRCCVHDYGRSKAAAVSKAALLGSAGSVIQSLTSMQHILLDWENLFLSPPIPPLLNGFTKHEAVNVRFAS